MRGGNNVKFNVFKLAIIKPLMGQIFEVINDRQI
jgi:hypothetical protein